MSWGWRVDAVVLRPTLGGLAFESMERFSGEHRFLRRKSAEKWKATLHDNRSTATGVHVEYQVVRWDSERS